MSTVSFPETETPSRASRSASLLGQMTLEEKVALLAGVDDWHFHGVPRLGVPSIMVTDCGHGVTLCGDRSSPATCFPTGIGMAATWNTDLLERAGRVIGSETRALGCSILLGPKINLHRHPLNGRSFETFSEDPWLAGLLGAAVIRGIQEEGVGACVKAVTANNQQQDQERVSSEVDEVVLREIYLRAFQLAVEHGNPCAIMTAYNRLNGHYCSESEWLIRRVIKTEWGFPGFIISDWRAVHGARVYSSGLDLEMPGPGKLLNRASVMRALEEGLLSEAEIDDKAGRILSAILRYGADESETMDKPLDAPGHRRTAREVAEESIVLLKNEGGILPLDRQRTRRILVTGPNAAYARLGGGGSASVTPFYSISPLEGLREICGEEIEVRFIEGCSLVGTMETISSVFHHLDRSGQTVDGLKAEFFNTPEPGAAPDGVWTVPHVDYFWGWASPGPGIFRGSFSVRYCGFLVPPKTGRYRLGIYALEGCVRLHIDGKPIVEAWDAAGSDNFEARYRTHYLTAEIDLVAGAPVEIELCYGKRSARAGVRLEWEIPGHGDRIERIVAEARQADAVIVCAGLSNLFEGGAQDRSSIEIPEAQRELIETVARENPRTVVALNSGGVLALPWESAVPAILQTWYPGQEGGRALARILFGEVNPSGRLPDTIPMSLEDCAAMRNYPGDGLSVRYEEGPFIGYRHFDHAEIAPRFPFGFGLSYTDFSFSPPEVREARHPGDATEVRVIVENTGHRPGKTVAQLYLSPPRRSPWPPRELRAFQKIHLQPGEKALVIFSLAERELETFDPDRQEWMVHPGRYTVHTGAHSRSLQKADFEISAD